MSEQLAFIRKKGGGGADTIERVLWSNPSPSENFAPQTVNLSDDINNYDYLKISYRNHPTIDGVNDPFSVLISVSDFKTSLSGNSTRHNVFTYGGLYAPTNTVWTRLMFYDTDTTAKFGAVTQIGGTGSGNANAIPLQIVGIKQHGTIKPQTTDLSSPPNAVYTNVSMANNATATLAVTQMPKYIVICMNGQTSSYNYGTLIINVEDNTAYMIGYWSSTFQNQVYSAWTDFITSVSDSAIGIKNSWGGTVRMDLCVYY